MKLRHLPSASDARPDLRRAGVAGLLALLVFAVQSGLGAPTGSDARLRAIWFAGAALFAVVAAVAVRGTANEVSRVTALRTSAGTASNVRLGLTVLGYVMVAVTTLTLLQVPIEKLLLSGAITGVVLGIAAQQALANLFAGLVLLTSRPFEVGSWILLRSGSLGGEYTGQVVGIGLTYTELMTDEGRFSLPNAAVLAAATSRRPHPGPQTLENTPPTSCQPPTPAERTTNTDLRRP